MSAPVAVITGASRGIGRQLAVDFAKAGYDIVCLARSSNEHAGRLPGTIDETAGLVEAEGRLALALSVNVGVEEEVATAADRVFQTFGRCDLVINNAALAPPGQALEMPLRRWRQVVDVNLNGPMYLMYYFCPRMIEAGGGAVLNVSSYAAVWPQQDRPSYTATKAGLEALTQAMAFQLESKNVAVNALRIELRIWSEGFAFTLGDVDRSEFEDPVIVSDALLWLARQPAEYTGHIHTLTELRERGIVRPSTKPAGGAA